MNNELLSTDGYFEAISHLRHECNRKKLDSEATCLNCIFATQKLRRGVRVAEGARLESVYRGNSIAGSNPALSAKRKIVPR
jgi:hypothetical protein